MLFHIVEATFLAPYSRPSRSSPQCRMRLWHGFSVGFKTNPMDVGTFCVHCGHANHRCLPLTQSWQANVCGPFFYIFILNVAYFFAVSLQFCISDGSSCLHSQNWWRQWYDDGTMNTITFIILPSYSISQNCFIFDSYNFLKIRSTSNAVGYSLQFTANVTCGNFLRSEWKKHCSSNSWE